MVEHSWETTSVPGISRFEDTMRCPICKDLLRVPQSTNCGHSFCAVCIRRQLAISAKCPVCQSPAQTAQLRMSKTLEDTVELWTEFSNLLFEKISNPAPVVEGMADVEGPVESALASQISLTDSSSALPTPPVSDEAQVQDSHGLGTSVDSPPPTQPARRRSSRVTAAARATQQAKESPSLPVSPAKPPSHEQHSPAQAAVAGTLDMAGSAKPAETSLPPSRIGAFEKEQIAQCPVCTLFLPVKEIEGAHIVSCLSRQQKGNFERFSASTAPAPFSGAPNQHQSHHQTSKGPSASLGSRGLPRVQASARPAQELVLDPAQKKGPRKLQKKPLVNYTLLKLPALGRLLRDDGLASYGTRNQMIERHKEWVIQWNANADSKSPEPISVVRKRVGEMEAALIQAAPNPATKRDFNSALWVSEHEEHFRELEDVARQGARKMKKFDHHVNGESANTPEKERQPAL